MTILSRQIRVEIIAKLTQSEMDVSTLADELELDVSTVSRSLRELRDHGLVLLRQDKRRHIYRLSGDITASLKDKVVCIDISSPDGGRIHLEKTMR